VNVALRGFLTLLAMVLPMQAATVTLTVKVIDGATLAGIPGATVRLISTPRIDASGKMSHTPFSTDCTTDAGGSFSVEVPEQVRLWLPEIKAAGYAPHDASAHVEIAGKPVSVTYRLNRVGTISGRVVDGDSGEPIANLRVAPLLASWARGRRQMVWTSAASVTGKDGSFALGSLTPGEYVLDLNSFHADKKPTAPVAGYPQTIWPGAGDMEGASPVSLAYGAALRLGDIRLRKRELSRVTVSVAGGPCTRGQMYDVMLAEYSFYTSFTRAYAQAPCGGAAHLVGVRPGEYELRAEAGWQAEKDRELGAMAVQVGAQEEKATVTVSAPIAIHGKITVDRGGAMPAGMEAHLFARGNKLAGFSHVRSSNVTVGSDGAFETTSYVPAGGEVEVDLSHLPAGYYVREVAYDGVAMKGDTFVIHAGSEGRLAIALSDRAAAVNGTVRTAEGEAVTGATVLLTQWPADVVSGYPFGVETSATTPSGGYSFARLRPGTYRAFAVASELRPKLEEPGVMLGLFAAAETFEAGEGATVVRHLAPVAPR
jgi:hypothetical protein